MQSVSIVGSNRSYRKATFPHPDKAGETVSGLELRVDGAVTARFANLGNAQRPTAADAAALRFLVTDLHRIYRAMTGGRSGSTRTAAFRSAWIRATDDLETRIQLGSGFVGKLPRNPGREHFESTRIWTRDRDYSKYSLPRRARKAAFTPDEICEAGSQHFARAKDTTYSLRAGELTDSAKELFMTGQCHAMAYALAEATGWPICVLQRRDGGAPAIHVHFAVQTPGGKYLDAGGLKTKAQLAERFGGLGVTNVVTATAQDVDNAMNNVNMGEDNMYVEPRIDLARSMVSSVLRSGNFSNEARKVERLIPVVQTAYADSGTQVAI